MTIRKASVALVLAAFLLGVSSPHLVADQPKLSTPKYVFLFIGDGMGFEQVKLAQAGLTHRGGGELRMTRLPVKGSMKTRSANLPVTDSAAAATALARGRKTNNGMIGQTPDGQRVESICKAFVHAGMKVGVLTSVGVNHATPAGFYGHAASRNQYNLIASQFPASGINLLAGCALLSEDKSQAVILEAWKKAGVQVVEDVSAAASISKDAALAIIAPSMASNTIANGDLAHATAVAIDRLYNPDGFFIMVEGGAIDSAGHANMAWRNLNETLAFDRAIEAAYRFYVSHPDDTLIIVTADHETGGMSVLEDSLDIARQEEIANLSGKLEDLPKGDELTTDKLTAAMVDVFGIAELSQDELAELSLIRVLKVEKRHSAAVLACRNIAQARAGVKWSTGGHTGVDVPVYAAGAGSEAFAASQDNTDISRKILEACKLSASLEPVSN